MPALKLELAVLDKLKSHQFHCILPPFKDNDRFLRNKYWFEIRHSYPYYSLTIFVITQITFSNYIHCIKHTLYKNNVENVHSTLLREEEFNSDTIMLNKQRIILPGDIQHAFDSLISLHSLT